MVNFKRLNWRVWYLPVTADGEIFYEVSALIVLTYLRFFMRRFVGRLHDGHTILLAGPAKITPRLSDNHMW